MQGDTSDPLFSTVRRNLSRLGVTAGSPLMAGVSGGVDSMSMLFILHQLGYSVTAAHVNFNLRGSASINDALFIRQWCFDKKIPYLELSTDTKTIAAERQLNVQSAARQIRYEWWERVASDQSVEYIATAHHLDDTIETLFLNLLRGTGFKGMLGIPARRGKYIRPLLDSTRQQIEVFAQTYSIPYRTDESNLEDTYQRNKLRHHLIPMLKELNPDFYAVMEHNLHRMHIEWETWEDAYLHWQEQSIQPQQDGFLIQECAQNGFLLRWLEERGFPWQLSFDYLHATSKDKHHALQYDRFKLSRTHHGYFFEEAQPAANVIIPHPGQYDLGHFIFSIVPADPSSIAFSDDPGVEFIHGQAVQWPLHLRSVRPGDLFQPLGMQGKSRKLQDLLVDLKMDIYAKERVMLLCNDEHILWVTGIRLDERAKITSGDEVIYRVEMRPKSQL